MLNVEKFIAGVHEYIGRALAPFAARVKALEDRAPERGEKGDPGAKGEKGDPGAKGEKGLQGERGEKGNDGDRGVAGADGSPGKSAYQLAVERGFGGTELQWLDSLTGKPGRDGANGKDAAPVDTAAIAREAAALVPVPRDGKDADPERVRAEVERAVSAIPRPKDGAQGERGKDAVVDYDRIGTAIKEVVAVAVDEIPRPKDGKDGASVHPDTVARMVREAVDAMPRTLVADGKDGRDGKDADPAVIAAMVSEGVAQALPGAVQRALDAMMPGIVAKAAEAVPRPRDGVDGADGKDAAPVDIGAIVREAVALIPAPRDGRDAPELDAVVDAVVKRLPEVKNGRDGKDAPPIDMDAVVAKAIALIPAPKDGADGASVTLDDLRPIIEAATARWQLEFERGASEIVQRFLENIPRPSDGKDGRDAVQLDTFDAVLNGRVLKLSLTAGDRVVTKDLRIPIPIDRGVYRSGHAYEQSDTVTYSGAVWIALRDTATKPPSADWRLCVARGRDGKDASP